MTSFIAAGGSGRSTSFIPAVPAAWSVTTIAFMELSPRSFGGNVAGMGACRSRTNADDSLPVAPLGRIEGVDGVVERRGVADVRSHPTVLAALDVHDQLRASG